MTTKDRKKEIKMQVVDPMNCACGGAFYADDKAKHSKTNCSSLLLGQGVSKTPVNNNNLKYKIEEIINHNAVDDREGFDFTVNKLTDLFHSEMLKWLKENQMPVGGDYLKISRTKLAQLFQKKLKE